MKGVLYERKGHEWLLDEFGPFAYIPGQWFQYQIETRQILFCQTDGLLFNYRQRKVLIIEFKYKHTVNAYRQLEEKYVPVIKRLFRDWEIATCEIVKWYDPSTEFPVEVCLKRDLTQIKPNEFAVHIFNP